MLGVFRLADGLSLRSCAPGSGSGSLLIELAVVVLDLLQFLRELLVSRLFLAQPLLPLADSTFFFFTHLSAYFTLILRIEHIGEFSF